MDRIMNTCQYIPIAFHCETIKVVSMERVIQIYTCNFIELNASLKIMMRISLIDILQSVTNINKNVILHYHKI